MMIKVEIYRDDGTLIVMNYHPIHWPGEHDWAMHPSAGCIIDGDFAYSGYTLEVHGREKVTSSATATESAPPD